jgi:hypothetical protein
MYLITREMIQKLLTIKTKIMSKIYIENSTFMEFIDELVTRITEERFGEETYKEYKNIKHGEEEVIKFTDEAQDFYNDVYDEYETLTNNLLGVYNSNELNK